MFYDCGESNGIWGCIPNRGCQISLVPECKSLMPAGCLPKCPQEPIYAADMPCEKGIGHARSYFNPARDQVYHRYAPAEWHQSNLSKFTLSERQRGLSEKVRIDAWQSINQADAQTRSRQAANTVKLAKRRDDIAFWKSELCCEVKTMCNEMQNLTEYCRRLNQAYQATRQPLAIAENCLHARENRQGIDKVADTVESSLTREAQTIRACQNKMRCLMEKAKAQMEMNRAAKCAMEADARDKHHAQGLDDRMHQMNMCTANLGIYPGVDSQDNTITNPFSWVCFTKTNIARSQKQRQLSEKLRNHIEAVLKACANHMWTRFNQANNELQSRIQEVTNAKNKLQEHLQQVNKELSDAHHMANQIRSAMAVQCNALRLAMTRLKERQCRINVEICHDSPMKGLIREVREIEDSIKLLQIKLQCAEQAICRLEKTRNTLQQDIRIKERSLDIDGRECVGLRKDVALDPKVAPIFKMPLMPC